MRLRDDSSEGRLYLLDGLRFVAALGVVLFHYTGRENPIWGKSVWEEFPDFGPVTSYGGFGPYLFFMISGFVVLMSAWDRSIPSFVGSRVGRLYPAYWFAVVLTAVIVYTHQALFTPVWQSVGGPQGVVLNLTMFQQGFGGIHLDGVYWTLWVELKFYVLLGLMMLVGITRSRMLVLCLLWPLLGAMATQAQSQLVVALLEPTYAPFFCIGILLYLIRRDGWALDAGLLLAVNCCAALWIADTYYSVWTVNVLGAPLEPLAVALLVLCSVGAVALATVTPVSRLRWRWLTVLGALTYPLYLTHQAAGWVLIQLLHPLLPKYVVLGVVLGIVLCLAYLVHLLVERPLGPRLRRGVARGLAGGTPSRTTATAPPTVALPASAWTDPDEDVTSRWPMPDAGRVQPRVDPALPPVPPVRDRVGSAPQKLERHSRARNSIT